MSKISCKYLESHIDDSLGKSGVLFIVENFSTYEGSRL